MEGGKRDFLERSIDSWREGELMKPSEMEIRAPHFSQERGFSNIVQVGSHQEQTLEGLRNQKVPPTLSIP